MVPLMGRREPSFGRKRGSVSSTPTQRLCGLRLRSHTRSQLAGARGSWSEQADPLPEAGRVPTCPRKARKPPVNAEETRAGRRSSPGGRAPQHQPGSGDSCPRARAHAGPAVETGVSSLTGRALSVSQQLSSGSQMVTKQENHQPRHACLCEMVQNLPEGGEGEEAAENTVHQPPGCLGRGPARGPPRRRRGHGGGRGVL